MGWKIRNRVPSDEYLAAYDKRVADREAEIRRPGRKIRTYTDAELYEMSRPRLLREEWQRNFMTEVRRRNYMVRSKLFLFFQDNFVTDDAQAQKTKPEPKSSSGYNYDGGDDDENGPVDLLKRAQAAVCKSITKDFLLYCQIGLFQNRDDMMVFWRSPMSTESLSNYACYVLGTQVDQDDIDAIQTAAYRQEPPSKLITSQMSRDFKEIEERIAMLNELSGIEGYTDHNRRQEIHWDIEARVMSVMGYGMVKSNNTIEENHVSQFHEALKSKPDGYGNMHDLTSGQITKIKALSNTAAKLQALQNFMTEAEWSSDLDMLKLERDVLASIVTDDAVRKVLLETIMDCYLTCNKLVEVVGKIRNRAYYEEGALDKESQLRDEYAKEIPEIQKMEYGLQGKVREYSYKVQEEFSLGYDPDRFRYHFDQIMRDDFI
ncbi:hypothetical protein LQW54_009367 [Pestalotiopsis sp. IQ-011]